LLKNFPPDFLNGKNRGVAIYSGLSGILHSSFKGDTFPEYKSIRFRRYIAIVSFTGTPFMLCIYASHIKEKYNQWWARNERTGIAWIKSGIWKVRDKMRSRQR
jgi:hypothetical protein